jgi:glutathione S-transferase
MGPMITLHTFPGRFGLESMSPFCMKAEVYLKLAKLEYRAVTADPRKAPKTKLPYIDDGGTVVCDSTAILDYLEKKSAKPLDEGLSEMDRARAWMIQRTFEEGLYFIMLWSRWTEDEGWEMTRTFFERIPSAMRWAILPMIRRQIIKIAHAQGTGRHSRDEIFAMGERDLRAFVTLLGDSPFVLGDRIRTVDCSVYAFLANVLVPPHETPLKAYAKTVPQLDAYVKRVQARLTPPT